MSQCTLCKRGIEKAEARRQLGVRVVLSPGMYAGAELTTWLRERQRRSGRHGEKKKNLFPLARKLETKCNL